MQPCGPCDGFTLFPGKVFIILALFFMLFNRQPSNARVMPPPVLEEDAEIPRGLVPYPNYGIDTAADTDLQESGSTVGSAERRGWRELLGDRNPIETR